jgi:selenide, water dikinase
VRTPSFPDLLVGTATGDDAAVWRVDADRAMVATVDFFTPIVDDARTWGAIAAANSVSDVYAMGARPLFALNVAAWPRADLPLDLLGDVLEGAGEIAERGRFAVIGGHTIDGPEPMYGMSVTGEVHPDRLLTNDAARVGDTIVLTKAIGTGIVATALKRCDAQAIEPGGVLHESYLHAVETMTALNDRAAAIAVAANLRAATDITGFGLTGHLHKLALASGVDLEFDLDALPLVDGVERLRAAGYVPGGTGRNLEFVGPHVHDTSGRWDDVRDLLADPQTSGGLALCVPADRVDDVCSQLLAEGLLAARIAVARTPDDAGGGGGLYV